MPINLTTHWRSLSNECSWQFHKYKDNSNQDLNAKPEDRYVYNAETLGFRLYSRYEIDIFKDNAVPKVAKINNLLDYAWNIIESFTEAQQNVHLHGDDSHRTIYIDSIGIKTTDFNLTNVEKENLEKSGEDYTRKYFKWYDNPENDHHNKSK